MLTQKTMRVLGALTVPLMACAHAPAQEVAVSDVRIEREVLQGEPLSIAFTLTARDDDVSATTFVLEGSVDEAPEAWDVVGLRTSPRYQVMHEALTGEPVRCECSLPPRVTADLQPGRHSAFVAVLGLGPGWRRLKLGEFTVLDASQMPMRPRSGPPAAAILSDDIPAAGAASGPERVAQLARNAGCTTRLLTGAQVADPGVFSRERFDLVVLPSGGSVPGEAIDALARFMRRAGALITIGGPSLTDPVQVPTVDDAPSRMIADMEGGAPLDALSTVTGEASVGELRVIDDGAAGTDHALAVAVEALPDWFYAEIPVDQPPANAEYIEFHARGDAATDRLCVEVIASDESRWKYFIDLESRWRAYSIPVRQFASYASPQRDAPGDHLRPEEIDALKLGFYRHLYGASGARMAAIDQVRLSPVAHHEVQPRRDQLRRWWKQYSYLHALPAPDMLEIFREVTPVRGIALVRPPEAQVIFGAQATLQGPLVGWQMLPRTSASAKDMWSAAASEGARYIPLLRAFSAADEPLGDVAGMVLWHRGAFRGACAGWLGISSADLLSGDRPGMAEGFRRLVRAVTASAHLLRPEPTFAAREGAVARTWSVSALARGEAGGEMTVRFTPADGGEPVQQRLRLQPARIGRVEFSLPAGELDLTRIGGTFELVTPAGEVLDRLVARADPLGALKAVGDALLANQEEAGNYSPYFYADVYGARALRVLSELTGDDRYRESGLRMTDMLVADQRPDGGWWVGYGEPRELVFVADDGCIALGLVQLAPYVDRRRREAYLAAARRHIDFREGFRITGEVAADLAARFGEDHPGIIVGGLGIGWVRNDYFSESRFDEPTRELRQKVWTLHCSLAFLGGLCALDASPRACELAAQDTRWFLERIGEGRDGVISGYANEAAVWMLDTLQEPELRERLRTHLAQDFLPWVIETERDWWLDGDGRRALMLPGLVYCARHVDTGPEARAELARAVWGVSGTASPVSLQSLLRTSRATRPGGLVMYSCFSSVGLAELLAPRSTMLPRQ